MLVSICIFLVGEVVNISLVNAKCMNCGATLTVNDNQDVAVCEFCHSAFIVEKAINNYVNITQNVTNNSFVGATVNIVSSKSDIEDKIKVIIKLMDSGLEKEAFPKLHQLTKEYPEDYRPWFLIAKYNYEKNDVWLDSEFSKEYLDVAKALANEKGKKTIQDYYTTTYNQIVSQSSSTLNFYNNIDYEKIYYSYLVINNTDGIYREQPEEYIGVEPINNKPTIVTYSYSNKYGYIRREWDYKFSISKLIYKGKIILPFMGSYDNNGKCSIGFCFIPHTIPSELFIDNSTLYSFEEYDHFHNRCSLYITDVSTDGIVYNDSPRDMFYGGIPVKKITSWEKTGGCYIATSVYGSYDCPEVWTLRRFRDNYLADFWFGKVFIKLYYSISPKLVKLFGNKEWFKKFWKKHLDLLVKKLNDKGYSNTKYID